MNKLLLAFFFCVASLIYTENGDTSKLGYIQHHYFNGRTYFDLDKVTTIGTHIILNLNNNLFEISELRKDEVGFYVYSDDMIEIDEDTFDD